MHKYVLCAHAFMQHARCMHVPGQILGAEAAARVPAEFVAQHRMHANPPTLLLRLQRRLSLSSRNGALGEEEGQWLELARELWPRLKAWYAWFVRTQAGSTRPLVLT